ncbi:MAG: FixH family protein [Fibrobacteria bacterium]
MGALGEAAGKADPADPADAADDAGESAKSMAPRGLPGLVIAMVILIILVAGANGLLVWLSSHGKHELVRGDYYDSGLDLDGSMARAEIARAPGMDVTFRHDGAFWRAEAGSGSLGGTDCKARLYRPDNGAEDLDLNLGGPRASADDSGRYIWSVPSPALRRGYWNVHLTWERAGKPVMEESFRIFVDG